LRLYVAKDMSDTVDVIDISRTSAKNGTAPILETIKVAAPPSLTASYPLVKQYTGANTNRVTLSPDESQLYVTNGNLNAVAVVQLTGRDTGDQVVELIPTGWYLNQEPADRGSSYPRSPKRGTGATLILAGIEPQDRSHPPPSLDR
jgi:DNA-binding beta-propeller fold protein YncE